MARSCRDRSPRPSSSATPEASIRSSGSTGVAAVEILGDDVDDKHRPGRARQHAAKQRRRILGRKSFDRATAMR
jgi:hypothetical protein